MNASRRVVLSAILMLLLASGWSCSRPDNTPESEPANAPVTVPLFDNLGSHHHAITTSNQLAQQYFDQGLRLTYGFNHDEAERAFREAARLDPSSAMAWWGVALALGPNINLPLDAARNARALDAVQKAQSLLAGATESERAYVAAIATRYSADPKADRVMLDEKYSEAMRDLSKRYPEDNDAAVLYAESLMDLKPWQLWTRDGKPQEGTEEILRVLEGVLARDPNHPGANHYYIHSVEASPNPEKAADSAERLRTLVPGAGHLVHMPAHVYIRTGNYAGAIEANAHAVRVDEEYISRTKAEGVYPMMYYTHNFMFLSTAAGMAGKCGQALESAGKAIGVAAPMIGHEPMVEYVLPWSLFAMARCERWDDILVTNKPADSTRSTQAFWHYARGLAHVAKGDLNLASIDRAALRETKPQVAADFMLNLNRAQDLLSIAEYVLDARIAGASGKRAEAIALWNKAIELQDRLTYDEPPAWYYPVRESLGGEYLRLRRFADAEKVFRQDLEKNPHNPRSIFGLVEALRGQSKNTEDVQKQLEASWKNAEIQLSVDRL